MNPRQPWYALNARQLLAAREAGMRPDGVVQVTLTAAENPPGALLVRPDMPADRLDWRMLVDLPVWLWADASVPFERLAGIARGIAARRPSELLLRFLTGETVHDVEVGYGNHHQAIADIPAEHTFVWLPLNLGGTSVGARLMRALQHVAPCWSRL